MSTARRFSPTSRHWNTRYNCGWNVFRRQLDFERIVMPEAPRLLRFARRLTRDTPGAEDLVQEALLKAWRGFHQFHDGSNARAWLYRILVNASYGQGRKIRAAPTTVPLENQIQVGTNSNSIERLEMNQALDSLPRDQRTVLLLGVVEGFTCREVSEILSVPMGTVMSRLSRARQSLREKLAPEHNVTAAGQKDY
jgi:RNA polymerase sigma-70 factor (ECF subfamily)